MKHILWCLSAAWLATSVAGAADATPSPKQTGDLWEVTSQMTMEGMPAGMGMPPQTRRVCTARDWTKPPVPADDRSHCEMVDFQNSPTKSTWKMKCEGMTGEGQITRTSPDAYTGWMKMAAPQGAMTMNLTGRKVGECDAGEAKKEREAAVAKVQAQVAAGEKMAADAKQQSCMAPVASLDLALFNHQTILCTDTVYKTAFCDRLKSYEGFKLACTRRPPDTENGLTSVAAFCGADPEFLRTNACGQAEKLEDLEVLGSCCPVQARALAAAHCAGRTYTSMIGDKYQRFCATFAVGLSEGYEAAPPGARKAKGKSGR